jgi:hypothetical protein
VIVSDQVQRALEADWSPLCNGTIAACQFSVEQRGRRYHIAQLRAGEHHIQITVSSTGRSVRVHVDGQEIHKGAS